MDIPLDLKLFMNNTTQKVYKCDHCNASYSDKSYFDLHKQTHQNKGNTNTNEGGGEGEENGDTGNAGEDQIVQIVMPAPAHQQDQVLQQDQQQQQQLTAFKRAYGGEMTQIYEIAPSTRYQVVTSGGPHVLAAVSLASLPGQVTLPSYTTTPTYVLADQLPQGLTAVTATTNATTPATQGQRTSVTTIHEQQHHHHHETQHHQIQHQQHQQPTIQHITVQQQQQQQQQEVIVQHHTQQQPQPQQQQQQQQQQQRLVIALEAKERPYKCDQCTASFIDPTELTEHKKKHSGDGPFTCEDCHFTFMYKSHFRSHKTRCLKKRALMPNPPKPILNPGPIKRQFPTHHSKATPNTTTHQHQQQHQQPQQQQQPTTTQHHQQHQQQHHQTHNTRSANTRTNTNQNKQANNTSVNVTNSGSFNPNNPSFKRQRKEQRLDRPFECNECDASFQTAQDLQGHKAKHTGEGPFKCEECRFVFLYRKLYEAHRRRCEKKRKDPIGGGNGGTGGGGGGGSNTIQHQQPQQQLIQVQTQQQPLQQQQQQQQVVQTVSGQQLQIHSGRSTLSGTPATVQLSGPIQIQTVAGHPQATAVIDMRSLQAAAGQGGGSGQGAGGVQHLQHPTLIEQVIHVTQVPGGSLGGGGRQEIKYDLVPATVDVADMNQIMNLIKVNKGHQ